MNCENCHTELKYSIFSSNKMLSVDVINTINNELNLNAKTYCNFCGDKLYKEALNKLNKRLGSELNDSRVIIDRLKNRLINIDDKLNKIFTKVPVLTTHSPFRWEYTSLGVVSAQMVTGTGVVSEFLSDFTDFFGAKSNSFTQKLIDSERCVLNQLKSRAIILGGNAVIATDIDYGEVGGSKGMLMICAAGTAVKLNNLDILEENIKADIVEINSLSEKRKIILEILSETPEIIIEKYNKMIDNEINS